MNRTGATHPLVFGEVLYDRFPDGAVVLGGAPFNVAWNLQALGAAPLFVSRVGRDELGDRILTAMRDWGLDRAAMQVDEERPTGTVEVTMEDGEPAYEISPDRAYDNISAAALPAAAGAPLLYHGSLALRAEPSRRAFAALRKRADCPILMDVNLRDPWWEPQAIRAALDGATWAKLNEDELARIAPGGSGTGESGAPDRAGRLIAAADLEALIVTHGADGVSVGLRGEPSLHSKPAPEVDVVDTVGAGDAFSSVVILGLLRGWDWSLIVERALAFAGAVVGLRGATTEDRHFYDRFLTDWEKS